jgi:tetratricopeptide (TPR) repeat protein
MDFGKILYEYYRGDPFAFSFGLRNVILDTEYASEGRRQEPENLVSKEMRALIKKIDEIEEKERIQNNELWKATIMSTIMGIANITLERKSHPKLFTCSRILPARFWTLLQNNNILLKESNEGQLSIRHEMFAYEFLSVLYENNFNNATELFNEYYGYIVKCIWDSIGIDEIIDMLSSCSYLYDIERYRPIAELITGHYLVPSGQYSPPPGIHDSDKAKLFCYGLGNFYLNRKDYERSLEYYNEALKIKPDYVDAWNNKGNALDRLGKYEDAIVSYDKAIELAPNDAFAWANKGSAFYHLGMYEEAIKHYDKAIELAPNDAVNDWNNKGIVLANLGRDEEAIACYDRAIELKPNDEVHTWYSKGEALANLDRHEEAIQCYDKALEIDPNRADAWYNRARYRAKKGDAENSLADLKEAIEIDKEYIESAKQEKDFESIRNDDRFKALIMK